jgi:SAM-dependent methyltransferase
MRKFLKFVFYKIYTVASYFWLKLDRIASWGETRHWIDNVPRAIFTPDIYVSYAGWMHNQGFFASLLSVFLKKPQPRILDFGCGMGNLAPVCHHFVKNGGSYLGVDLDEKQIAPCLKTYGSLSNCSFYLTHDKNPFYTPDGESTTSGIDWPVKDGSLDLVIAMSVFTHLQEAESIRYLNKIHETLAADGLAMISFLIKRDYINPHFVYNFDHALTPGWFTSNPSCPEMAIGLTREALEKLLANRFEVLSHIEGSVTGGRHPSLQDIFVLRKLPAPGA